MAVALFELIPPVLLTRPHPADILAPQNGRQGGAGAHGGAPGGAPAPPMARVWPIQNPHWPRDFRAPGGRPDRYLPRLDGQIGPGCAYIVT